jgi:hypoxanthine phosphoribosyltransferase
MNQPRKEITTWREISKLVSLIPPQFEFAFDAIIMVSPSGIIPAGMLAAVMGINEVHLARVEFSSQADLENAKLLTWPNVTQFPDEERLADKKILVVIMPGERGV